MKFKNILLCLGVLSFSTVLNSNVLAIDEYCDIPNVAPSGTPSVRNFEIQKIEKVGTTNSTVKKSLEKSLSYYRGGESSIYGTYSRNIKINNYLIDSDYSMAKALNKVEGYVTAKDGSGFRLRYDYSINNIFLGAGLGYGNYDNYFTIDRSLPSTIEHKVAEAVFNIGYILDTDSFVRPFVSLGGGYARIKTELKFFYDGQTLIDKSQTNRGNNVVQNKPFWDFETGIRATQNNLLMILGYNYRHIFDLNKYTNSRDLNMTNGCGSPSCRHYDISTMKLDTHNLYFGFGFTI